MRDLRGAFAGPSLVGFDFDGTLAPLVRDAERASMRRLTKERLVRLARKVPCAVISGRALADLQPRVRGVRLAAIIGSHGIEPFFKSARLAARARSWQGLVGAELEALAEARLEHKPFGMTVHYRGARKPDTVRRRALQILSQLEGARVIWGNAVADVVPLGAPTKSEGLQHAQRHVRARHVIYVGDDVTDEDVFRVGDAFEWITIRVGRLAGSRAQYYLGHQREIDRLLATMLEFAAGA